MVDRYHARRHGWEIASFLLSVLLVDGRYRRLTLWGDPPLDVTILNQAPSLVD